MATARPISRWNYKTETEVTRLGPTARVSYSAFAIGMDDKQINMVDADGVALTAILGLNKKLEEQVRKRDVRITALENELVEIKRRLTKFSTKGN
jgi:hypothetical protein